MQNFSRYFSLVLVLLIATNCLAKPNKQEVDPASDKAAALILKNTHNQVVIEQEFSSIENLKGFVIKPKGPGGKLIIVYADKDGSYMLIGDLFDTKGANITHQDINKHIQSKLALSALKNAKSTHWFLQGDKHAPHTIYVLVEPNCSLCHELYFSLKPLIDNHQLSVRWILTSFINDDSKGKATAILSAKNPALALDKNERLFDKTLESGGIRPQQKVDTKIQAQIDANNDFISSQGFPGTPVIIYRDKKNKPQLIMGVPGDKTFGALMKNISSEIDEIS